MNSKWAAGQGNVPATKGNIREIIQNHASGSSSELSPGEVFHDAAGDDKHYMCQAGGVFRIAEGEAQDALKARVDVETDANGKGIKRVLVAQTEDPDTNSGEVVFYAKLVEGVVEVFARYPSSGTVLQLTSNGSLNVMAAPSVIRFTVMGDAVAADDLIEALPGIPGTIAAIHGRLKTGTSLDVTIYNDGNLVATLTITPTGISLTSDLANNAVTALSCVSLSVSNPVGDPVNGKVAVVVNPS